MIDPASASPADTGGGPPFPAQRFQRDAMACTFDLILSGVDARYARRVAQAALDEIDRLEQLFSRFIPHSDIARINALAAGQSVRVSAETAECLQLAAQVYTATRGAFDIAYRSRREMPAAAEGRPGPPLVFDPAACAVGVPVAPVELDLGAIGKGYAIDRVVAVLHEWGIKSALVHSGQSTGYAVGQAPGGDSWRVALRDPDQSGAVLGHVELIDAALSGSGQLLHGPHIIDPRDGRPADRYRATWAMAPSAALSDALSTAFMAMPVEEVAQLCAQREDVSAILLPAGPADRAASCFGPLAGSVRWSRSR
jgi:thiamine biosynthesis lipoprotein